MSTTNNFNIESPVGRRYGRLIERSMKIFSAALLAVALTACGPEAPGFDEPEQAVETETSAEGLFPITCDLAEAIYNAVCDEHGNSSSQCTGAYDALHCYCQDCSPPSA